MRQGVSYQNSLVTTQSPLKQGLKKLACATQDDEALIRSCGRRMPYTPFFTPEGLASTGGKRWRGALLDVTGAPQSYHRQMLATRLSFSKVGNRL